MLTGIIVYLVFHMAEPTLSIEDVQGCYNQSRAIKGVTQIVCVFHPPEGGPPILMNADGTAITL